METATIAVQDTSAPHAFDAARENWGMVAMGVIVLVLWLLFRTILKPNRGAAAIQKDSSAAK